MNLKRENVSLTISLIWMISSSVYGKDSTLIDSLVNTVHGFCTDIGMEQFGLKKCGVVVLMRGKVVSRKIGGIGYQLEI